MAAQPGRSVSSIGGADLLLELAAELDREADLMGYGGNKPSVRTISEKA